MVKTAKIFVGKRQNVEIIESLKVGAWVNMSVNSCRAGFMGINTER